MKKDINCLDCCDTVGCNNPAEYYDDMDNKLCINCVEKEIEETGKTWEDFETI